MTDNYNNGNSEIRSAGVVTYRGCFRGLLLLVLLFLVVLKLVDTSWLTVLDTPMGYLTLAGLITEITVAALVLLRFDRLAGLGLFLFGLGIVGLTPLLPSCKCLGPLILSRSQRTAFGFVFGLAGACLFLWARRPQVSPLEVGRSV